MPFYRDRLDAVFNGGEIDCSRWSEIPILTREQANRDRLYRWWRIDGSKTMVTFVSPRKVFKARLIDQYSANEVGQIACQCPHCKDYHINSETVLVEILDQEGAPVAPGETGRVVLTSFYNYAMPFIRYEIGDNAQVAKSKPDCRITLPRLTRIMGRYRNNFTLRDGRIIFPHPPVKAAMPAMAAFFISPTGTDNVVLDHEAIIIC